MRAKTLWFISITASFAISLAATLASYNVITHPDQVILDAGWVHRGWPVYWMIESWSFWSPPPYPHYFTFQPVNFLVDFIFYTIVFLIPIQIYTYSREVRKSQVGDSVGSVIRWIGHRNSVLAAKPNTEFSGCGLDCTERT